jgi:hypothetical protein
MYQHQYSRAVQVLVENRWMVFWVLLLLGQGMLRAAKEEDGESEHHA